MKEVEVAKLDAEDQKKLKELAKVRWEIDSKIAFIQSAHDLFWEGLGIKYKLGFVKGHYIKDKAIYRAED